MRKRIRIAARRELPTLLPPGLQRLLSIALALAGFMVADTIFLVLVRLADRVGLEPFALGASNLPRFYQALLLAHTGAGLLLAAVMAAFLVAHLPRVWPRQHAGAVWTGASYAAFGLTLAASGLFITSEAASQGNSWAWWLHSAMAVLAVAGYWVHRRVSHTPPAAARFTRFLAAAAATSLALFVVHGAEAVHTSRSRDAPGAGMSVAGGAGRDAAALLQGDFGPSGWVPTGAVPPESPFFPSPVTTTTGRLLPPGFLAGDDPGADPEMVRAEADTRGFVVETRIGAEGCGRCHQDIVNQWSESAHRFASFNNPFYEATIRSMRSESTESNRWIERHLADAGDAGGDVGRAKSKWCAGCHDPVLLLGGMMTSEIDRGSLEAQAGLTCLACHAIDRIHELTGNGNYNVADRSEDPYVFASAPQGSPGRFLHDAALKARPRVHAARMLKPFFRESAYCATCHKVGLTEPVNGYRWLRGQNEFDAWDDSGVSLNAARTFYLPPERRECQDCHMPPEPATLGDLAAEDGMVRSHRFLAANTALPFLRGDDAALRRIEDFLRADKLRIDVFAVRTPAADSARLLVDEGSSVPAGVPITFDVVTRNLDVGHTFPGGTNDSNEGWIEFTVSDSLGQSLFASGLVGSDGHLDPRSHTYKSVLVDRNGDAIDRRNAQDIHTAVYANVIGPGTADLAHYRLTLPTTLTGSPLTVTARLLWRKFDRAYTEFAFESNPVGFPGFDAPPELPITEIASDSVLIRVTASGADFAVPVATEPDWTHHNDYGIALLLEGDLRGAGQAFARVEALAPDRIDGPLNLARTALAEGRLTLAYNALERSEAIESGNPRSAWVWGQVLQEDGRYEDAASAYRRVLHDFPDDRAAWRALGRTLFLDGRYQDALAALDRVLDIDPEDRVAHYHRMLSLRALGRDEAAARAEAAYLYYGIDESAQEITRAYRARHPGANTMAQRIRIHRLEAIR
ncbi:MAG: tetratricopeptide repeat protein [Gemmatimonadetes bacterium]|nr:tetratricopeptide repeat protein [Gemmatimonadota bacterium]